CVPYCDVAKEGPPGRPCGKACSFALRAYQRLPVEFSLRQLNSWNLSTPEESLMRTLRLTLVASLLTSGAVLATPPLAPVRGMDNVRTIGEVVVDKDVLTARDAPATLVIGTAEADTYRLTAEVKFVDKATGVELYVMPIDPAEVNKPAALY